MSPKPHELTDDYVPFEWTEPVSHDLNHSDRQVWGLEHESVWSTQELRRLLWG